MNLSRHSSSELPVAVVLATYNGERYLSEQVDSILNQTRKPARIYVSDDRSADNTLKVLEEFTGTGLVSVAVNGRNLGVIGNFINGVNLVAQPAYIALADQDDIWFPEKLEVLYNRLTEMDDGETPAMVYSDLTVIDRDGKVLNRSFWNELGQDGYRHSLQTLLYGNFVTGCTVLMNEKMAGYLKAMPNDVPMHDYWLALIGFTFGKVEPVPQPLVYYRKHDRNVAHSENFRKETRLERRLGQLRAIIAGNEEYLKPELSIASKFFEVYKNQLNADQRDMFETFLDLRGKSFLRKKLAFKKAFKSYWR